MADLGKKFLRVVNPLIIYWIISAAMVFSLNKLSQYTAISVFSTDASMTTLGALLSFPVLFAMWRKDNSLSQDNTIPVNSFGKKVVLCLLAFFTGIACSWCSGWIMSYFRVDQVFSNEVQESLLAGEPIVLLIGLALVIPVTEELLFRGLVYGRLREAMDKRYAIAASVLIFALAHGNMIQILYAIPMALLIHLFYEIEGTLLVPVWFHIGANLISVLLYLGKL